MKTAWRPEGHHAAGNNLLQDIDVAASQAIEEAVEQANEHADRRLWLLARLVTLENHRAQHRREREGDETRQHDRRGHRDRKLSIENADRSAHEGDGYKHCSHHQRDRDDSPGDFTEHFLHRHWG